MIEQKLVKHPPTNNKTGGNDAACFAKECNKIADFDKEEQYLNEMAQKGHRLVSYNSLGVYTFNESEPQSLHYRIDWRKFPNKAKFDEYLAMFQDSGWEHVYGTCQSGSQYFLPMEGKAQTDDIFSDDESRIQRYKRFAAQSLASFAIMTTIFLSTGSVNLGDEFGYLAKGLQDMSTGMFLMALLASIPLFIAKVVAPMIFLLLAILYGTCAVKARKLYQ